MRSSTVAGTAATYAYDADGWRVKTTLNGGVTSYFLRGVDGKLLSEWTNTTPNAQVRDYIYAGTRLIGMFTAPVQP